MPQMYLRLDGSLPFFFNLSPHIVGKRLQGTRGELHAKCGPPHAWRKSHDPHLTRPPETVRGIPAARVQPPKYRGMKTICPCD